MGYTTYVDPNTGFTYAYDPNWQYNLNPAYIPKYFFYILFSNNYLSYVLVILRMQCTILQSLL
jgi:hypothetical protein